jgi:hypothetical protein
VTVIIYADSRCGNLETGEEGYDEEAMVEAEKNEVDGLMAKIASNAANSEDYKSSQVERK